jgi:hypothetical protein
MAKSYNGYIDIFILPTVGAIRHRPLCVRNQHNFYALSLSSEASLRCSVMTRGNTTNYT